MNWFKELLTNQNAMCWAMAFIVFIITFILKFPIKWISSKIANNKVLNYKIKFVHNTKTYEIEVKKLLNTFILLIPFSLGVLAQYLYMKFGLKTDIVIETLFAQGFQVGSYSMAFYAVIERFTGKNVENIYNTENTQEGEAVQEIVEDVKADGKLDTEIDDIMDKISNA